MLTVYRRHRPGCKHRSMGQRRCNCPVWVHGKLKGKFLRQSLNTRNWEAALKRIKKWEETEIIGISLETALERFYSDAEARGLGNAQLAKYKLLKKELTEWFPNRKVGQLTIDDVRGYRESWDLSAVSAQKKLERLKTFFRFCQDSGWIEQNPARVLKPPKAKMKPTLPLSKDQLEKITWAFEVYPDRPKGRREQVRAFVLLLRYSGLRIGDAVSLKREKLQDGKLMLYTGKTGTPVYIPLPEEVTEALNGVEDLNGRFFWSGNGILKSAVADWQRTLAALFKLAGVKAHAHQFRHTFAVNLLQSGVSLETVSILLGHSSLKITEKHYAPWVKSRQVALEVEIQKVWDLC